MKSGNEDYGTNYQIIRVEVGSGLHGTNIVGYDDHDEMGVAVEPLESFFSYNRFEQYIFRTQDEGVRSGFGDTDLVVYSLYKYLKLALDGNPTILQLLFVPPEKIYYLHDKGIKLLRARDQIISRLAGRKYLGYMRQQGERLTGERGGKHTNRPELIERYGFDTKYAMHMIRLGLQGIELLETGTLTFPMAEPNRSVLLGLRQGSMALADVLHWADELETKLQGLCETSDLPPRPSLDVPLFLMEMYIQ